jgi:hypothetical protein
LSFTRDDYVYAVFTGNATEPNIKEFAAKKVQPYDNLPQLEEIKQEPHKKDASGEITHQVISAKIPLGSYAGAKYTLGYMDDGGNFVAVLDGANAITSTPDDIGKLLFTVPAGKLNESTQYIIRGVDPVDAYKQTDFTVPTLDLTGPAIVAADFGVLTGNPVAAEDGKVTTDDPIAALSYVVSKDTQVVSLPEGIVFDPATGKFSGKTADTIPADQVGAYIITVTAEDFYGNKSTKNIVFTVGQKPTTNPVGSITQNAGSGDGNVALTVQGEKGAAIKLYTQNSDGSFTEIDIPGVTGKTITGNDGKLDIILSKADMKLFNGNKVFVTQTLPNELESVPSDGTSQTNPAGKEQTATGGAIVIDTDPPAPLRIVQPEVGTDTLKIINVSANDNQADISDVDKIVLTVGTKQYILTRQYDANGNPTGDWKDDAGNTFTETTEDVDVINPSTGVAETKNVRVLNFKLPGNQKIEESQNITATYYDYLGNVSESVYTVAKQKAETGPSTGPPTNPSGGTPPAVTGSADDEWFIEGIHKAYIKGYPDGTVQPDKQVTRAEAVTIIVRVAELEHSDASNLPYADTAENGWYNSYLNAAEKHGMLLADGDRLRPDEPITRAEFVKALSVLDEDNDAVATFADVAGHRFENEINKVFGNARVEGYGDGSFRPDSSISRAEVMTIINRMYNRAVDAKGLEKTGSRIAQFTDLSPSAWYYYEIVEASNTHEYGRRGEYTKDNRNMEMWTRLPGSRAE